jgi:protein tyrosine phosphatase (PTP) superfamily phosphohydrolase (DUF442 family)
MTRKAVSGWLVSASLATLVGCCGASSQQSLYPPSPCNKCGNAPPPGRFTPVPGDAPPPGYSPPPGYAPPPSTGSALPPSTGSSVPPNVRLAPPETVGQDQPRTSPPRDVARLEPPQTVEPPPVSVPNGTPPVVKNEPPASPRLPVDIPQFAMVRKGVASGQQPFPDGVAWLQSAGYRAVLYVRAPGETDTAAQRIFEKRGLRYLSIEVGPNNLTREVVERFNKIVADEANQPLFVFDRDSSLAGALWYINFRTAEGMSDEKARTEAARLGFRNDQDDNSRTMWIAVQKYLRDQNP